MKRTCFAINDANIKLEQIGRDNFTVTYGLQIKRRLTYSQAATELGCVIMHDAACRSALDNRERNER
jgi:hypothetical protein